ncbi:MAG: glycosyltransferase [Candidatus Rokubacteria bacterium]|nr:glycosyltransferase [Candidatus Rokubacteria bacterium]
MCAAIASEDLPACSVIIPILNEEECLPELTDRLLKILDGSGELYEVIFVDDGSTDGGPDFLRGVIAREPRVCLIRLLGHFGQHAAISAGIDRSRR